jgi:hypothetical protein
VFRNREIIVICRLCSTVQGCIHKFPDWPPGTRTANGTALCHQVQLYCYSVSLSSEFCHNHLCCFSSVYCCCLFHYRLDPEILETLLYNGKILVEELQIIKEQPETRIAETYGISNLL